jgi:hypothetical protein
MSTRLMPLTELSASAIRIPCEQLGAADTARFLNQFNAGFGDHTRERRQRLGKRSVADVVEMIVDRRESDRDLSSTKRKRGKSARS